MKDTNDSTQLDFPFWDVAHQAARLIVQGATVRQKFTCVGCRSRLTAEVANQLFKTATCQACGVVTDIEARGCNFLVEMHSKAGRERRRRAIHRAPVPH
jgi:hypothetical protein